MARSKKTNAERAAKLELMQNAWSPMVKAIAKLFGIEDDEARIKKMCAYAADNEAKFMELWDKQIAKLATPAAPAMSEEEAHACANLRRLMAVGEAKVKFLLHDDEVALWENAAKVVAERKTANIQREQELVNNQQLPDLGSFLDSLPVMEEEAPPPTDDDCPFD